MFKHKNSLYNVICIIALATIFNAAALAQTKRIIVDDIIRSNNIADDINSEIQKSVSEGYNTIIEFTSGKTYRFFRSIIVYDNVTIDGHGCTITFDTSKGMNAMYGYSAFITNRKVNLKGNKNDYDYTEYGHNNIVIKNITFDTAKDAEFWFGANSERGILAFHNVNNLLVQNVHFDKATANTPIWITDANNVEICYCTFEENPSYKGATVSPGGIWSNRSRKLSNIYIHDNSFVNYRDESISICAEMEDINSTLSGIRIENNTFKSVHYSITLIGGENLNGKDISILRNRFIPFDNVTPRIVFINKTSYDVVDVSYNEDLTEKDFNLISFVAPISIKNLVLTNNLKTSGGLINSYLLTVTNNSLISYNTIYGAKQTLISHSGNGASITIKHNNCTVQGDSNSNAFKFAESEGIIEFKRNKLKGLSQETVEKCFSNNHTVFQRNKYKN